MADFAKTLSSQLTTMSIELVKEILTQVEDRIREDIEYSTYMSNVNYAYNAGLNKALDIVAETKREGDKFIKNKLS